MSEVHVTIAVPTSGMVRAGFAYSLAGLTAFTAGKGIPSRQESMSSVKVDFEESSVIHGNRERMVRKAIDEGRTHLMFLDDDMVFEPHILDLLMNRRQEVVVCNYMIKSEPEEHADWVSVGLDGRRIATTKDSYGMVPIHASGFGVSLFDLEAFKRTPQPWFEPRFVKEKSSYTTEDYPCYERLRAAGATVYLDQDASKLVSHLGTKAWNWRQWVSPMPGKEEAAAPRPHLELASPKYRKV